MGRTNYNNYGNRKNDDKMFTKDVEQFSTEPEEEIVRPKQGKVYNCEAVYLRSHPTRSSQDVTILNKDAVVTIISDLGDWYEVEVENLKGFVMKEYVTLI